jgi:NNP family nitrate/nitrite transporter-like MFS transporter
MTESTFRWLILVLSWLTAIGGFVAQLSPPPLMPLLMRDFMITHAESGLVMTLFSLPGLLVIVFGVLSDRFGAKQLGVISIFSLILGSIIVAISPSFEWILLGRVLAGVGTQSITVVAPAIISQWFPPAELGTAMGIYGTGLPIAVVLAFDLLGRLGIAYGWRLPFYLEVVVGIAVLGLFWRFVRDGPLIRKPQDEITHPAARLRKSLMNHEAWKIGAYFLLVMAGWAAFTTWASTLLNESKGLDLAYATSLASVPMMMSLVCMPFIGWFSDRIRRRKLLITIGSTLMTSVILIISYTSGLTLILSFVILGVAFALIPGMVFSLAGEALGPGSAGTSFGILITCVSVGQAVAPYLVGLVRDMTGFLLYSFAAMSMFIGPSILVAFLIKAR